MQSLSAVVSFLLLALCSAQNYQPPADSADPAAGTIYCNNPIPSYVEVFMQSKDPFAAEAISLLNKFAKSGAPISVSINFIADELDIGYASTDPADLFTSTRGSEEVSADIWELCAQRYLSNFANLDLMECFTNPMSNFSTNMYDCLEASPDLETLKTCYYFEGKILMEESIQFTESQGVNVSPTVMVNNVQCADLSRLQNCICTVDNVISSSSSDNSAGSTGTWWNSTININYPQEPAHGPIWLWIFLGVLGFAGFVLIIIGIMIIVIRRRQLRAAAQPNEMLPTTTRNGYAPLPMEVPQPIAYNPNMYAPGQQILVIPLNLAPKQEVHVV